MVPVVFDFDGVLAASMKQHAAAYAEVLGPLGVQVSEREVLLREGARSESIIHDLLRQAGVHGQDVAALAQAKQEAFEAMGRPPLYDGAEELVESVMERTAVALVTGTRRVNLEAIIPGLLPRFQAVLTQESYTHDKPHPEPYLKAAEALAVPPEDCIAVENAIHGVQSARAAGYASVLALCSTLSAQDLAGAGPDAIAADHAALGLLIDQALDGARE